MGDKEEGWMWEELRRRVGVKVIKKYKETFKKEEITKRSSLACHRAQRSTHAAVQLESSHF